MKWITLVGLCLVVRDGGGDVTWWNRYAASISCSAPGYFVNPADCKSFYRCVDRSTWDKPALQRYDFTCPEGQVFDQAVSVCTKPGSNGCADPWWSAGGNAGGGSPGSSGGGGGNNAPAGDSNGLDLDSLPPLFSSSRKTTTKPPIGASAGGGAWFEGSRPASSSGFKPSVGVGFGGAGGGDPLDAEFGSPSDGNSGSLEDLGSSNSGGNINGGGSSSGNDAGFNRPSVGAEISFGSGRPSLPAFGGGGGGRDPLDAEFGTPSDSGSSGSLEDLNLNNSGGSKGSVEIQQCLSTNCGNEEGSTTNRPSKPSWFNRPSPSKNTNWDRNDGPSSSEKFDPWSSNQLGLGQVNRPINNRPRPGSSANANANWGGAPRPGFGDGGGNPFSPWRPNGPWGASSENPPISPGNRSSWWDPPFALPFHTASAAPPPPPEPWANPFRQRYPSYQIVAYPTWPGPYTGRNPVIVVYSNSKK